MNYDSENELKQALMIYFKNTSQDFPDAIKETSDEPQYSETFHRIEKLHRMWVLENRMLCRAFGSAI